MDAQGPRGVLSIDQQQIRAFFMRFRQRARRSSAIIFLDQQTERGGFWTIHNTSSSPRALQACQPPKQNPGEKNSVCLHILWWRRDHQQENLGRQLLFMFVVVVFFLFRLCSKFEVTDFGQFLKRTFVGEIGHRCNMPHWLACPIDTCQSSMGLPACLNDTCHWGMGLPACPNGMCQRGMGQQARAPLTRVIWNTSQWSTLHRALR